MQNGSYAQLSPETVLHKLPGARALLREARIDSSSGMRLSDAALAASVNTDELLAMIEDRLRRQARRARQPQPVLLQPVERYEEEFELV